jgi:hypothetical protein
MANVYVRSAATGTADGSSWSNACTTLTAGIAASAAGDDLWVSEDHAETTASALTLTLKGTISAPNRVICVNHAGSVPPVSADLRTTGSIATTGTSNLSIVGFGYFFGLVISAGTGSGNVSFSLPATGAGVQVYENCALQLGTTGSNSNISFGNANGAVAVTCRLINTTVQFSVSTAFNRLSLAGGRVEWLRTPNAIAGSFVPTNLFSSNNQGSTVLLDGVDFSAAASGKTLFAVSNIAASIQILNCKLGSGVTVAATPTGATVIDLINSDSGATNYRQERYTYQGTLLSETTTVRSGGASDGVTPLSWKISTTANAKRQMPFEAFQIVQWVDTAGSSKNATVEVITDNLVLTNADCWVEAEYLGSSAQPIGAMVSSGPADALAAGSNLTTSTATWGSGPTTPKPQSMSVSLTPQMKGYVRFIVKVAKASATVWIDPAITIV